MDFKARVIEFIEKYQYRPSEFGRRARNDPSLISRMLNKGRSPTLRLVDEIEAWMELGPDVHDPAKRRAERKRRGQAQMAQRQGTGPTAKIVWTDALDAEIIKRRAVGEDWEVIGKVLGISSRSAKRRALKAGLVKPRRRRT